MSGSWDQIVYRYDAVGDGCFTLINNDRVLSDAEVLAAYRYQPNLERHHHHLLKSIQDAAPVLLYSPREKCETSVLGHVPGLTLGTASTHSLEDELARFLQEGDLAGACTQIIGRGVGLTPAGDDVAAGILVVDSILSAHDRTMREEIARTATTHEISRSFLSWAAVGQSIEPFHTLLAACSLGHEGACARITCSSRRTWSHIRSGPCVWCPYGLAILPKGNSIDSARFLDLRQSMNAQAQTMT